MKKTIFTLTAIFMGAAAFSLSLTGYDIMKKADEVPEPVTSSSTATLTIHSKKGSDRIRPNPDKDNQRKKMVFRF